MLYWSKISINWILTIWRTSLSYIELSSRKAHFFFSSGDCQRTWKSGNVGDLMSEWYVSWYFRAAMEHGVKIGAEAVLAYCGAHRSSSDVAMCSHPAGDAKIRNCDRRRSASLSLPMLTMTPPRNRPRFVTLIWVLIWSSTRNGLFQEIASCSVWFSFKMRATRAMNAFHTIDRLIRVAYRSNPRFNCLLSDLIQLRVGDLGVAENFLARGFSAL